MHGMAPANLTMILQQLLLQNLTNENQAFRPFNKEQLLIFIVKVNPDKTDNIVRIRQGNLLINCLLQAMLPLRCSHPCKGY